LTKKKARKTMILPIYNGGFDDDDNDEDEDEEYRKGGKRVTK
jgi:hypothetical protein